MRCVFSVVGSMVAYRRRNVAKKKKKKTFRGLRQRTSRCTQKTTTERRRCGATPATTNEREKKIATHIWYYFGGYWFLFYSSDSAFHHFEAFVCCAMRYFLFHLFKNFACFFPSSCVVELMFLLLLSLSLVVLADCVKISVSRWHCAVFIVVVADGPLQMIR